MLELVGLFRFCACLGCQALSGALFHDGRGTGQGALCKPPYCLACSTRHTFTATKTTQNTSSVSAASAARGNVRQTGAKLTKLGLVWATSGVSHPLTSSVNPTKTWKRRNGLTRIPHSAHSSLVNQTRLFKGIPGHRWLEEGYKALDPKA